MPAIVNYLYLDYAHIPWKHQILHASVHVKYDGLQFQELLPLPTVAFCWWPAVNKALSPCYLSIIFVQSPSELRAQEIHITVDGKTKGLKKYICFVHKL